MKILIIDDHPLFRDGLRSVLARLGDIEFVEAQSFEEAIAKVTEVEGVDLILADLCLPLEDGFAGITEIGQLVPGVPIIVVSVLQNSEDIIRAFDCGAKGFIPKTSDTEVIFNAVRLVLAGGIYLPPALIAEPFRPGYPRTFASASGLSAAGHPVSSLTPRQRDVLALLAGGKSNRDIARDLGLAEGTVKVHITAIFKALGAKNRTQAVLIAVKFGRQEPE